MSEGGIDSAQLMASGAMSANVRASTGMPSAGGGKMLPFEGQDISGAALGGASEGINPIAFEGADSMFASLNQGGGALGQGLIDQAAGALNHMGTKEAQGDNIGLENMGAGERANSGIGNLTSEARAKTPSMHSGGAEMGG